MLFLFDFVIFDTIMHVTCSCTVFQSFQTLLVRCIFSFWEKGQISWTLSRLQNFRRRNFIFMI